MLQESVVGQSAENRQEDVWQEKLQGSNCAQNRVCTYRKSIAHDARSRTVRRRRFGDGTFRRSRLQMFYAKKIVFLKYFKG